MGFADVGCQIVWFEVGACMVKEELDNRDRTRPFVVAKSTNFGSLQEKKECMSNRVSKLMLWEN